MRLEKSRRRGIGGRGRGTRRPSTCSYRAPGTLSIGQGIAVDIGSPLSHGKGTSRQPGIGLPRLGTRKVLKIGEEDWKPVGAPGCGMDITGGASCVTDERPKSRAKKKKNKRRPFFAPSLPPACSRPADMRRAAWHRPLCVTEEPQSSASACHEGLKPRPAEAAPSLLYNQSMPCRAAHGSAEALVAVEINFIASGGWAA